MEGRAARVTLCSSWGAEADQHAGTGLMASIFAFLWFDELDTDVQLLVGGCVVVVGFLVYYTIVKIRERLRRPRRRRR